MKIFNLLSRMGGLQQEADGGDGVGVSTGYSEFSANTVVTQGEGLIDSLDGSPEKSNALDSNEENSKDLENNPESIELAEGEWGFMQELEADSLAHKTEEQINDLIEVGLANFKDAGYEDLGIVAVDGSFYEVPKELQGVEGLDIEKLVTSYGTEEGIDPDTMDVLVQTLGVDKVNELHNNYQDQLESIHNSQQGMETVRAAFHEVIESLGGVEELLSFEENVRSKDVNKDKDWEAFTSGNVQQAAQGLYNIINDFAKHTGQDANYSQVKLKNYVPYQRQEININSWQQSERNKQVQHEREVRAYKAQQRAAKPTSNLMGGKPAAKSAPKAAPTGAGKQQGVGLHNAPNESVAVGSPISATQYHSEIAKLGREYYTNEAKRNALDSRRLAGQRAGI